MGKMTGIRVLWNNSFFFCHIFFTAIRKTMLNWKDFALDAEIAY